jgi:multidrug efflux pump subunit AcrB
MLKNLIIMKTEEGVVSLSDVATVEYGNERNVSYTSF